MAWEGWSRTGAFWKPFFQLTIDCSLGVRLWSSALNFLVIPRQGALSDPGHLSVVIPSVARAHTQRKVPIRGPAPVSSSVPTVRDPAFLSVAAKREKSCSFKVHDPRRLSRTAHSTILGVHFIILRIPLLHILDTRHSVRLRAPLHS